MTVKSGPVLTFCPETNTVVFVVSRCPKTVVCGCPKWWFWCFWKWPVGPPIVFRRSLVNPARAGRGGCAYMSSGGGVVVGTRWYGVRGTVRTLVVPRGMGPDPVSQPFPTVSPLRDLYHSHFPLYLHCGTLYTTVAPLYGHCTPLRGPPDPIFGCFGQFRTVEFPPLSPAAQFQ